ncbi:hypothetical protein PIROE2DRAFT_60310 [Piromyces sp. E2]|nr:hypothetical protein PIROE2DRAFT_60310 [Piromyces sp. E2]|eukprot:OUM65025.1 hypothetical protein PIROE2DRAFT_60310 [Piromyces sp. E2]
MEWEIKNWKNIVQGELYKSPVFKIIDNWRIELMESDNKYKNYISLYIRRINSDKPIFAYIAFSIRNRMSHSSQESKEIFLFNNEKKRFGFKYFCDNEYIREFIHAIITVSIYLYKEKKEKGKEKEKDTTNPNEMIII